MRIRLTSILTTLLVLAYTPISKPGETDSVTFTAPKETGDYGYVCTFPGHWATMQGTMRVVKGIK